jgi:hypothetical protein
MSFPKAVLGGGLLVGLLAAPCAEARFGKRSDSSETSKPVHGASAIGKDDDDDSKKREDENTNRPSKPPTTVASTDDDCCDDSSASDDVAVAILGALLEPLILGMGQAIAATGTHHMRDDSLAPGAPLEHESMRHAVPISFRMGVMSALSRRNAAMDYAVGWDTRRFGMDLRLSRLSGTGLPMRTLSAVHVTFAPLVQEVVRLRAEAGISTANLPGRLSVGPSVGMSLEACVWGPLDLEARAQVTPFPYQQVDVRAGLALHLGSLMLRGGARSLRLSDEVRVAGSDRGFVPDFGLGFTF